MNYDNLQRVVESRLDTTSPRYYVQMTPYEFQCHIGNSAMTALSRVAERIRKYENEQND